MNEKITLQDLVELLSEKNDMTKKNADAFLRCMFDLIEEALTNEKYVKIKGLGTFKLTEVDSRESMNVNTGERICILLRHVILFTKQFNKILQCYLFIHGNRNSYLNFSFKLVLGL